MNKTYLKVEFGFRKDGNYRALTIGVVSQTYRGNQFFNKTHEFICDAGALRSVIHPYLDCNSLDYPIFLVRGSNKDADGRNAAYWFPDELTRLLALNKIKAVIQLYNKAMNEAENG